MSSEAILIAGCLVTFIFLGGIYGVLIGFFKDTTSNEFAKIEEETAASQSRKVESNG